MIKNLQEFTGIAFIAFAIGIVAVALVGICTLFLPFRWMIDAAAERRKKLCFSCAEAGLDRESFLQLVYYRPPGKHTCTKCRMEYTVERS